MTAVTSARICPAKGGLHSHSVEVVVKSGETLIEGALVGIDSSGEAVDAIEETGIVRYFIASETVTGDGTIKTRLLTGIPGLENGASIDAADLGKIVYCDDNATVKLSASGTSRVGIVDHVGDDGLVYVNLDPHAGTIAANSVDSSELASGSVDPVHMATTRYRSVASDGAVAIVDTDEMIHLVGSASGTKTITTSSSTQGQRLKFCLAARSGGQYDLAAEYPEGTSGTLTMDAAGESPEVVWDTDHWVVMDLGGGSFA